jgi:hypothetical protein
VLALWPASNHLSRIQSLFLSKGKILYLLHAGAAVTADAQASVALTVESLILNGRLLKLLRL